MTHPPDRPATRHPSAAAAAPVGKAHAGMSVTAACIAVMLLAFALLLVPGATRADAHPSSFPDVSSSDPAHEAIEYLTRAGVLSGYAGGEFRPGNPLNRGQTAKTLVLQHGLATGTAGTRTFTDLDSVYGQYVRTAAAKGWIAGYPDGTFRTYASLQRQHMATIIVRSLGWADDAAALTAAQVTAALQGVSDAGAISYQARPFVALALLRGLFAGGADGRLRPTETTTRAQFALVAYRAELRGLAVVQGIRSAADHPDKTRVVYDLSAKPGALRIRMDGLQELVVEMAGSAVTEYELEKKVGSREVEFALARQLGYRPAGTELRLRLNRFSRYEVTTMAPSDGKGYRVVVDVFRRTDGPAGDGPPLVALDAGHGGSDPGAIGVTGLKEKDVNLAITLEVDQYLRGVGVRTVLTRSGDTYPTLQERADIANEAQASVFVCIHNNAAGDPNANGTETFYWGDAEEYSIEGRRLAEAIHESMIEVLGSTDRGARTHWKDLVVLAETHMPAALAEVGFLTNAAEEAKLKDPVYRQMAAWAIARGILRYLDWNDTGLPPLPSG